MLALGAMGLFHHLDLTSGQELNDIEVDVRVRVCNCDVKSEVGDVIKVHYMGLLKNGTVFDRKLVNLETFYS